MTNREKVISFLAKISPKTASNADIVSHTGITPHQQVFQITRKLVSEGRVKGRRTGREWHFFVSEEHTSEPVHHPQEQKKKLTSAPKGKMTPAAFERFCQDVMAKEYGVELGPAKVEGVRKKFDLVSTDETIVGDAKYYTAVNGTSLPPAKFATIAEYVWLLEKTKAKKTFLIFGNDRRVPEWWLDRYGNLLERVQFYFLSDNGKLELLN